MCLLETYLNLHCSPGFSSTVFVQSLFLFLWKKLYNYLYSHKEHFYHATIHHKCGFWDFLKFSQSGNINGKLTILFSEWHFCILDDEQFFSRIFFSLGQYKSVNYLIYSTWLGEDSLLYLFISTGNRPSELLLSDALCLLFPFHIIIFFSETSLTAKLNKTLQEWSP
jgi:hypothetical protein